MKKSPKSIQKTIATHQLMIIIIFFLTAFMFLFMILFFRQVTNRQAAYINQIRAESGQNKYYRPHATTEFIITANLPFPSGCPEYIEATAKWVRCSIFAKSENCAPCPDNPDQKCEIGKGQINKGKFKIGFTCLSGLQQFSFCKPKTDGTIDFVTCYPEPWKICGCK